MWFCLDDYSTCVFTTPPVLFLHCWAGCGSYILNCSLTSLRVWRQILEMGRWCFWSMSPRITSRKLPWESAQAVDVTFGLHLHLTSNESQCESVQTPSISIYCTVSITSTNCRTPEGRLCWPACPPHLQRIAKDPLQTVKMVPWQWRFWSTHWLEL